MNSGVRVLSRFTACRRGIGGILAVLLAISVSGQLLPCVHGGSAPTLHEVSMDPSLPMAKTMTADGAMDTTPPAPMHHHSAPSSHHAPIAPGCALVMACGLVVQSAVVNTSFAEPTAVVRERPTSRHLQYATADLEVESPPPRG